MTAGAKPWLVTAAAIAAVAGIGWLASSGGAASVSARAGAVLDSAGWDDTLPTPETVHLCQPGDMGGRRLRRRHPVHVHSRLGGDRAQVSQSGWAWFADPPGEEGL